MKIECTVEELKKLMKKEEQTECKSECSKKDSEYLRKIAEKEINTFIHS